MGRIGTALLLATAALLIAATPSLAVDTQAPTAVLDAPATVGFGDAIPLSGSRSTDAGGGRVVEYRWTVAGRPVVVTRDPAFNAPAGTPPLAPGRYTAVLVVVDDSGNQSASTSANFVVVDDLAPTAVLDAPAAVSNTAALALSGARSSDVGGRVAEYRWTVGSRPVVVTSDPTFSSPPGLPPGRVTVLLSVVDDSGNVSAPTSASVIVRDDVAPTAVIEAPRSVAIGDRIPLDGSKSSDVGGRVIDYTWTIDSGTPVRVSDPLFSAPVQSPGRHTISLTVRDDAGNQSAPATASVFVGDDIPPTAVLDLPATVQAGASIPLSGARSTDVRGRVVRYRWTIDAQPPIVTQDPAFTAAALPLGRHTVTLVVTDDSDNESAPVSGQVVVADTINPTAVLDAPATAQAGATIALSGARSADVGGRVVRYTWTVAGRAPVVTSDPTFNAPGLSAGRHTISLVVTDDSDNRSAPDARTIDVAAPPPTGIKLTTFGKVTLIAPAGLKTAHIDLKKGALLAGRVFSPTATTLKATFTSGKLKLGAATVKLRAGQTAPLTTKLSAAARRTLKGKKKLKVTVKAGGTTRTVAFTVT